MTDKPEPKDAKKDAKEPRPIIHLGMMGDGAEEQNLGERGDPAKRIKEDEVDAAFNQSAPKKKPCLPSSMTGSGIGLDEEVAFLGRGGRRRPPPRLLGHDLHDPRAPHRPADDREAAGPDHIGGPRGSFDHRSISSIAFDLGFADLSYFNRTFRRRHEATPTEVRAQGSGDRACVSGRMAPRTRSISVKGFSS